MTERRLALLILSLTLTAFAQAATGNPVRQIITKITQAPTASSASFAAGLVVGAAVVGSTGFLEPYLTASDVPMSVIRNHQTLRATVVSVADGDTVRVRHQPLFGRAKSVGKLRDNSISVRLLAIDAPEIGKFGRENQPFAEEARASVRDSVLGKQVQVKCWQRDQYGRIVGEVRYGALGRRELSTELIQEGLAVVYTGRDASYGTRSVDEWKALQAIAQRERRGMWVNGVDTVQLPSEYKRAARAAQAQASTPKVK